MERVRPGVLLVRASFLSTSVLMTDDLPTLERPRKAISGRPGAGKCATSLADNMYRARIRMKTVSCVWVAHGKRCEKINSYSSRGRLGLQYVFLFDGTEPVPEREASGDDQADEDADQEEQVQRTSSFQWTTNS